ncbi:MAG: signal recognition particle-docking protein FtsY [Thermodesulfobacteriota bacterium]|nr:signal recognition particle-docking protein FtsY [Thermodesulfobacteriota bacterium]
MKKQISIEGKDRKEGLWGKLSKTRKKLRDRINSAISGKNVVDEQLLDEIEEILFTSDIGIETAEELIDELRQNISEQHVEGPEGLKERLKEKIISLLNFDRKPSELMIKNNAGKKPEVIMFIGVNGVGKTTTIAKLANYFQTQGQKVILVAADTFRAAATEQLQIWGDRIGLDVVSQKRGSDPASVVFDALSSKRAKNMDKIIIDTAGRLHTKSNLMSELKKIKKVAEQIISGAPHKVILVIDANTGQNAIAQAHSFSEQLGVTDIILTKLDGTAKGGIIIGISHKLHIPISFIGTGEHIENFQIFNPKEFADAIFD